MEGNVVLKPKPTFPPFRMRYRGLNERITAWLTCFLITSQGKGVGFFALDMARQRELKQHEIHLMGSLGNFLGSAIENAQLMETIRRHRQDLKRLTEKLFASQEEERRYIARELHDEAGQSLTGVKLAIERLAENLNGSNPEIRKELGSILSMIRRTSTEMRRLSYHLHPTLLSDLGLEPALNLYFKEIQDHTNINIEFHIVGFDQRLSTDIETVLYRFSQETLTNTLKYAGAGNFRLSIIKSYPCIIFIAEDDGRGFDPGVIEKDKRQLGLLGMRERAHLFGGSFQLRSKPGEGTRIRIEIPHAELAGYENTDSYSGI
jgi:signal transduction histidine kinase